MEFGVSEIETNKKIDDELMEIAGKRKKIASKKNLAGRQGFSFDFNNGEFAAEKLTSEIEQIFSDYESLVAKKIEKQYSVGKLENLINLCDDRITKLQIALRTVDPTQDPAEQKRHTRLLNELKEAADILEKNLDLREENESELTESELTLTQIRSKMNSALGTVGKANGNLLKKLELKLEILNCKEQ
jgi:hypothetical protein